MNCRQRHHGMLKLTGQDSIKTGRFARLFPTLPALYIDPLILHEVGRAGGVMEEPDPPDLTRGVSVGLVFFGQFIDHDMTLDVSSSLTANNQPQAIENVRTPTLDLDCLYGDGPEASAYLYDEERLITGVDYAQAGCSGDPDLLRQDLPRNPHGAAIIVDNRNDENLIISQMHLGFMRAHNHIIESGHSFEEGRRILTWHYQWFVLNDFLKQVCGSSVVDDILANGRKVYCPEPAGVRKEPFIPIEFAVAAYRFAHTMVPQKVRVQPGAPRHVLLDRNGFFGSGFQPIRDAGEVVDWRVLLESDHDCDFERAHQVDAKLAASLLDLPFLPETIPAFERSLAVRNLLRAQSFGIPSGEQVAHHMILAGVEEINAGMIDTVRLAALELGFTEATPLWVYMLLEGKIIGRRDKKDSHGYQHFTKGEGLGPMGARLVAETMIGILELDERSFLGTNRNWSPIASADRIGPTGVTTLFQLLTLS